MSQFFEFRVFLSDLIRFEERDLHVISFLVNVDWGFFFVLEGGAHVTGGHCGDLASILSPL